MRGELGKKNGLQLFISIYSHIFNKYIVLAIIFIYYSCIMLHLYIYIYISYIIIWRYNCRNNLKSVNTGETRPVAFEDFHWKQKVGFFLDLAQVRSKEP